MRSEQGEGRDSTGAARGVGVVVVAATVGVGARGAVDPGVGSVVVLEHAARTTGVRTRAGTRRRIAAV